MTLGSLRCQITDIEQLHLAVSLVGPPALGTQIAYAEGARSTQKGQHAGN